MRPHPAVEVLEEGRLLWDTRTGRHARVPGELRAGHELLLRRLGMLEELDLEELIPVRSRWSLLLPERPALWHALPLQRGSGGFPFTALPLDERGLEFLRSCNGARRLRELDPPPGLLRRLCSHPVQALQLRDRPVGPRDPGPWRLVSPQRPGGHRELHHHDAAGATSLGRYHEEISAEGHFDQRETTLAHAFARPHAALGGRRYGQALRHALSPVSGRVVEVGAGTGELARDFGGASLDYTRVDRSPSLLELQGRTAPGTRGLLGDALALPFEEGSVDLLLSNEVLADLPASPSAGDWPIQPEPGQRLFNTGAFELLAEAWRVLRPGGRLWLSEFGGPEELPTETTQLDHPEVSIHFGQLLAVARSLGFSARLLPVSQALGFDLSARWLSRPSWEGLRCLDPSLEARAWTAESVPLLERVEGLADRRITEDGPAPVVTRVWVLEGRKPG